MNSTKNKVVESADLYYQEGTSDKVYYATLEETTSGYVVNFSYGRRGSTLKTGTKTPSACSHADALKVYGSLVREKLGKGYQYQSKTNTVTIPVVASNSTYFSNSSTNVVFGTITGTITGTTTQAPTPKCVLLNAISETELVYLLEDEDFYAQPKIDGVRFMLSKENGKILAYNRKGAESSVPNEIRECVEASDQYYENGIPNFLIDGELVGNIYYVFDVLEYDRVDYKGWALYRRLEILKELSEELSCDNIVFIESTTDSIEKSKLHQHLKDNNKEGIVLKNKFAKYTVGRPSSGGDYLKYKFYSTASCIVTGINSSKRSVKISVYNHYMNFVEVGNVTIPPNATVPSIGSIIEVRYLYAYKGGSLYQPTFLGVRSDIDANECQITQLKYKIESVVDSIKTILSQLSSSEED